MRQLPGSVRDIFGERSRNVRADPSGQSDRLSDDVDAARGQLDEPFLFGRGRGISFLF
jgi:hypothetical protein